MDHNQRVQQEYARQLETIRTRVIKQVIGGRVKGSMWNMVWAFQSVPESQKCAAAHKDV